MSDTVQTVLADGTIFECPTDDPITQALVASQEVHPDHVWEPQTTRLLQYLAWQAQQVLIGGGWCGDHAIPVARHLAARGGVCHVFEPNPVLAGWIRHNSQLNAFDNVIVSEAVLWSEPGVRVLLTAGGSHAQAVCDASGALSTTTLDTYCRQQGLDHVSLLMLDIEGSEVAALQGATHLLQQHPAIICETHSAYTDWSHGLTATPLVQLLHHAGYTVYALRDFQGNVPMQGCRIELITLETAVLDGPPHGFNLFAVHNAAVLDPAVFRICTWVSPKLLLHKDPLLHHPTEWLTP